MTIFCRDHEIILSDETISDHSDCKIIVGWDLAMPERKPFVRVNYVGCAGCGTTEGVIGDYCPNCRKFYA